MYTLAHKEKTEQGPLRTYRRPLIWLGISLGCIAVTNIYALFGHGVRSDAMDFMFLYPLLGGSLMYLLHDWLAGKSAGAGFGRLAMNAYNSGIATLIAGGMLRGILDIAGTASAYSVVFTIVGWGLVAAGAILGLIGALGNGS